MIRVDYENNAETWWDSARAAIATAPMALMPILEGKTDEILCSDDEEREKIVAWARALPGWNDGPTHAPTALLVTRDLRADTKIVVVQYAGERAALLEIYDLDGSAGLYGAEDWQAGDDGRASFMRDDDGDIRQVGPDGQPFGRVIDEEPCSEMEALELLSATWPDTTNVFR